MDVYSQCRLTATIQQKAGGNTDAVHPEVGDTLLYTIRTRNTVGDSQVKSLSISDSLPEGLDYVPGSLKVDGVSATDAEGDDKGHYAAGQVVGQIGDITDTNWHTVQFQTNIKADQGGKDIRNVAAVNGGNVATPDKPEELVIVNGKKQSHSLRRNVVTFLSTCEHVGLTQSGCGKGKG